MTKYQQMAHIKRAVKKTLKETKRSRGQYVFPHLESVKKTVLPSYITDNPFYP